VQLRAAPSDAVAVEGRLLTLLHIEHRDWQAYLTSVGDAEAGIALLGPRAPSLLAGMPPVGRLGELPEDLHLRGRLWHWDGERGPVAELRVPAGEARRAWRAVVALAAHCGGVPVGRDATRPREGVA
jgi:hypothetical protein